MITRILYHLVNILIIPLFLFCSGNEVAGNGSEITNGVCVSVLGPADCAIVIAYPGNYLLRLNETILPETTFTDKNGKFSIKLGDAAWNLLIYDNTRTFGCFLPLQKDEWELGKIDLDSLGAIRGTVSDTNFSSGYIGIRGSPFYSIVNRGVPFIIENIPTFTYSYLLWQVPKEVCQPGMDCNENIKDTITGTIQVKSGSETTLIK
jgi:hypothetical protein